MKLTAILERYLATRRKPSARRRKALDIDQRLLDSARARLGAKTETETVRLALERVLNNKAHADFIRWAAKHYHVDPALIDV